VEKLQTTHLRVSRRHWRVVCMVFVNTVEVSSS
jgi:hypothetical protein